MAKKFLTFQFSKMVKRFLQFSWKRSI